MAHSEQTLDFSKLTPWAFSRDFLILLSETRTELRSLCERKPRTYESLLLPLDDAITQVKDVYNLGCHFELVVSTQPWRRCMQTLRPHMTKFLTELSSNLRLYQSLIELQHKRNSLNELQKRHLNLTLQEFRLSGVELKHSDQVKLAAIEQSLAETTSSFDRRVTLASNQMTLDLSMEEAQALPADVERQTVRLTGTGGQKIVRLHVHSVSFKKLMRCLHNRGLRRKIWALYIERGSKGRYETRSLIRRILHLRLQQAQLLGFRDVLALRLQTRAVSAESDINQFLNTLLTKINSAVSSEHEVLRAFIHHELGEPTIANHLQPWDIDYYAERLREKVCGFKEAHLRPFTNLPTVLKGLLGLSERLFGVRFERLDDASTWHSDVITYRVWTRTQCRGFAYFDLHPRPNKQSGAWMSPLNYFGEGYQVVAGVIVANFGRDDLDSGSHLDHHEMCTLFHEFGHLLHHLLSEVRVGSLAGTNVPWDCVELPSLFMESWCWSPAALREIMVHETTGAKAPLALLKKLSESRKFRAASRLYRQLNLSILDLGLHRLKGDADPFDFAFHHAQKFSAVPLPNTYSMVTSFRHLFSSPVGYSAGYYVYLWAEMLEADAFDQFMDSGVFSSKTGRRFRETILSTGNGRCPLASYDQFRGQPPSTGALLRRLGLREIEDA